MYHYAVADDGPITPKVLCATVYFPREDLRQDTHYRMKWVQPALARTCRRLRKEVLSYYYSQNVFVFDKDPKREANGDLYQPPITVQISRATRLPLELIKGLEYRDKSVVFCRSGDMLFFPAPIEVRLDADDDLKLTYGGAVKHACHCLSLIHI